MRLSRRLGGGAVGLLFVGLLGCGEDSPASEVDAGDGEVVVDAGEEPDPIDAGSGSRFLLQWNLIGGCLGGDELEATMSGRFDGRTFVSVFPCTAVSGLSEMVSPGEYDIQLRLLDNDVVVPPDSGPTPGPLVAISDTSGPHQTVENGNVTVSFSFPTATATIETSWSFVAGKEPQTCAQAGVANVDLEYERVGQGIERQLQVPCADGTDSSGDLPTGLYLVRATPVDGGGTPVFEERENEILLFVGNDEQSATFGFGTSSL